MTTIAINVDGVPAPQGSKTIVRNGKGGTNVREDNKATEPWRNAVAAAAVRAMDGRDPLDGPLLLEVTFRFPRPKGHYRVGKRAGELRPSAPSWCSVRPDLDKLVRALGDALTGIAVKDDAQFVEVEAVKVYGSPGVHAMVSTLDGRPHTLIPPLAGEPR